MRPPLIGIVAGEASGDNLGAGLMRELEHLRGDARFVGVGGECMIEQGLESLVSMERLSINGFVDPVRRLPELLGILRLLLRRYEAEPPDVFVGVDFNVFNLLLERRLRRRGIRTVHYVSPSVYAWRRGRIDRISRAADRLLALYPFEPPLYADKPVDVVYVGHPLADTIPLDAGSAVRRDAARVQLGIDVPGTVVALLPGSRMSEVRMLGELLLDAARIIAERRPRVRFVVPCVKPAIAEWLEGATARRPRLPITAYRGDARLGLTACDAALVKSGTSTLEAMLLRRPMVVSYRLGPVTYQVVRRLLRTPYVALPNILAGRELVPELLQDDATPTALAEALLAELDKAGSDPEYLTAFERLHRELRRDADARAAEAVAAWLPAGGGEASSGADAASVSRGGTAENP